MLRFEDDFREATKLASEERNYADVMGKKVLSGLLLCNDRAVTLSDTLWTSIAADIDVVLKTRMWSCGDDTDVELMLYDSDA